MPTFHMWLGAALVVLNLTAGVWGLAVLRGRAAAGRAYQQVLALSHTVVVGQAVVGLLLLGARRRAPEDLHYVYGMIPAVLVVFAYSARGPDPRRNILVFSVVALLAAAFAARAFMTGRLWD